MNRKILVLAVAAVAVGMLLFFLTRRGETPPGEAHGEKGEAVASGEMAQTGKGRASTRPTPKGEPSQAQPPEAPQVQEPPIPREAEEIAVEQESSDLDDERSKRMMPAWYSSLSGVDVDTEGRPLRLLFSQAKFKEWMEKRLDEGGADEVTVWFSDMGALPPENPPLYEGRLKRQGADPVIEVVHPEEMPGWMERGARLHFWFGERPVP